VYCEYAHLEGSSPYRLADIDQVVERIDRAVKTTGIKVAEFVDSTFNAPVDYTIRLCEELARTRVAKAYHTSGINPRFGSREVLEAMKAANVTAVYCSPDAAHPVTIEAYRKDFHPDQLSAMARDTAELGMPVLWSFILGGPGETLETAREVLRFIREEIDPMQVVMLTPRMRVYPGTALEQLAAAEGYPPVQLDLRQPDQFYLSRGIAEEELDAVLHEAVTTIGNLMTMSAAQAKITGILNRVNGLTGRVYPNWKDYPRMRNGMRLVRIPWT